MAEKGSIGTLKRIMKIVDHKTPLGKKISNAAVKYATVKNSSKLSLLCGLAIELAQRKLEAIEGCELVDYQEGVDISCICGQHLTKEVYRMRVGSYAPSGGLESQIYGKIKDKVPLSRIKHKGMAEFPLGSTCYKDFPDILRDLDFQEFSDALKDSEDKARKRVKKDLDSISLCQDSEIVEAIKAHGIDPSQMQLVYRALGGGKISLDSILFVLDPAKRNSFANWFRERINSGLIKDQEITTIYKKLEKAPQLVQPKDLAALAVYSYEFREFDSKAVIGGIKDDLLYLASQPEDSDLAKIYRPNLDKHYVRPATRFRSRKGLEKVTVRKKLEQSHLTFLEALGIMTHFPEIEEKRIAANRKFADEFGVGRSWDNLLGRLKPVFEETKKSLAEEYGLVGKIFGSYAISKPDYIHLKNFFKRSQMGSGTERENYIRLFSIREFREIAPIVVAAERKIAYLSSHPESGLSKERFFAKETFGRDTKLGVSLDELIDRIEHSYIHRHSQSTFVTRNFKMIKEFASAGVFLGRYVRGLVKEYEKFKDYKQLGSEKRKLIEELNSSGLVKLGLGYNRSLDFKYFHGASLKRLEGLHSRLKSLPVSSDNLSESEKRMLEFLNGLSSHQMIDGELSEKSFDLSHGRAPNVYLHDDEFDFGYTSSQRIREEKSKFERKYFKLDNSDEKSARLKDSLAYVIQNLDKEYLVSEQGLFFGSSALELLARLGLKSGGIRSVQPAEKSDVFINHELLGQLDKLKLRLDEASPERLRLYGKIGNLDALNESKEQGNYVKVSTSGSHYNDKDFLRGIGFRYFANSSWHTDVNPYRGDVLRIQKEIDSYNSKNKTNIALRLSPGNRPLRRQGF